MNSHFEIASDRGGATPTPHPPEARRKVFVPRMGYAHPDHRMQEAWSRWGGETEFISDPKLAGECAICIFSKGNLGHDNSSAQHVKPFFDRYGLEANVFEYDDRAQVFRRINPEWLATYYPPSCFTSGNIPSC